MQCEHGHAKMRRTRTRNFGCGYGTRSRLRHLSAARSSLRVTSSMKENRRIWGASAPRSPSVAPCASTDNPSPPDHSPALPRPDSDTSGHRRSPGSSACPASSPSVAAVGASSSMGQSISSVGCQAEGAVRWAKGWFRLSYVAAPAMVVGHPSALAMQLPLSVTVIATATEKVEGAEEQEVDPRRPSPMSDQSRSPRPGYSSSMQHWRVLYSPSWEEAKTKKPSWNPTLRA